MTVAQLRQAIARFPDDTPVITADRPIACQDTEYMILGHVVGTVFAPAPDWNGFDTAEGRAMRGGKDVVCLWGGWAPEEQWQ